MRSAALLALALVFVTAGLSAQRTESRPADATDSAVARGGALFHGSAGCAACHGDTAIGTDVAPPLTGALWLQRARHLHLADRADHPWHPRSPDDERTGDADAGVVQHER